MYKKLTIENFRGIKSASFDDLRQFNIIIGKNNSSKTSILESIYLLCGPTNTELLTQTNRHRNFHMVFADLLRVFFYRLDINKNIKFTAELDTYNEKRSLEIKMNMSNPTEIPGQRKIANPQSLNSLIFKFVMQKADKKPTETTSTIELHRGKLEFKSSPHHEGLINGAYMNSSNITFVTDMIEKLDKVIFLKQLDIVIKIMKQIEPNLINITIGNNNVIFADIGLEHVVPINILGASFVYLLSVIISIMNIPNGVLLIDNVETYFGMPMVELFWTSIFRLGKEFNVQVIATTSSSDTLKTFHSAMTKVGKINNDVKAIKIDKTADVIKTGNALNI